MNFNTFKRTGICCICKRETDDCWNNPEPLRDGTENCCGACNRLVTAARRKLCEMPQERWAAYTQVLQGLEYEGLLAELIPS
ncbi:MAG: hypothetical protein IJ381_01250 [Clostridia bacterium]|nr:hypothetical protein [Clostridia bacterium]